MDAHFFSTTLFFTADYILMFFVRKIVGFFNLYFFLSCEKRGKRKIQRKREDPPALLIEHFYCLVFQAM
jgi:hypothetical protein